MIFSFGPTAQVYWGNVKVNGTEQRTNLRGVFRRSRVLNFFSFAQFELVIRRFGDGAISLYFGVERDTGELYDGDILPRSQDQMTDIEVAFDRDVSGIKFLFNWP